MELNYRRKITCTKHTKHSLTYMFGADANCSEWWREVQAIQNRKWKWNADRNLDHDVSYTYIIINDAGKFEFFFHRSDMWSIWVNHKATFTFKCGCFRMGNIRVRSRSNSYLVADWANWPKIFGGTKAKATSDNRPDQLNKICSFHVPFVWIFPFDKSLLFVFFFFGIVHDE